MSGGIVFMGTSEFAVPALERLVASGERVSAVYTQPPRPAKRGQKLQRSCVHEAAERLGLEVRTPKTLKDPEAQDAFRALEPELALVASYGLLLRKPILEAPARGCFNLHASILPRWRGAAPIQRAIEAGDETTGVTIFAMEEGLDTGPVLLERPTEIRPGETSGELHDRLALMAADAVPEFLAGLRDGSLQPTPQPEDGVTYARKIDKAEAELDLTRPAAELERKVRAFQPGPCPHVELDGERLFLREVRAVEGQGEPGEVLAEPLVIATGDGALEVLRAQRPGRKAMSARDLVCGWPIPVGAKFR